jgi:hypothetical protein
MKTVRLFFVMMVAAVLAPGTSLARQAHPSQQAPSQGIEKSDSNYQRDVQVRDENDQTRSGEIDQISKRLASSTKTTTKRRSNTIHFQPAVSHPRRLNKTPAPNGPRIDTPRTITGPQETGLKTAVPVQKQVVSHRLPAPSSAVSVNGQQFKNSRDPGAHLAVSGGPLTSSSGTAAINGTNMKRKP